MFLAENREVAKSGVVVKSEAIEEIGGESHVDSHEKVDHQHG